MSFRIIQRGAPSPTVIAEFHCDGHGRFDLEVARVDGDPPAFAPCPNCAAPAVWCISAPRVTRVQRITAVRGKSEKPERETWLDTTNLGEGQSLDEFHADRAAIRERQRQREYMELKKRGDL